MMLIQVLYVILIRTVCEDKQDIVILNNTRFVLDNNKEWSLFCYSTMFVIA